MDLFQVIRSSHLNQKAFSRNRNWARWMAALVSLESGSNAQTENQLVVQIAQISLWSSLMRVDNGYLVMYHLMDAIMAKHKNLSDTHVRFSRKIVF